MRKAFVFGGLFWGLLLVIAGVLLVLRNLFGIPIPSIWGIIWPLVIIYIGTSILYGKKSKNHFGDDHNVVFDEGSIEYTEGQNEYSAVFSRGNFDLTDLKAPKNGSEKVKVSVVFGKGTVKIKKGLAIRIKATSVFGESRLPNNNAAAFGDAYYESKSYKKDSPYIYLEAAAVFGSLDIIEI